MQFDANPTTGALTPKTPEAVAAGTNPLGVAVSPDGKSAYVINDYSGNVSQYDINPATGALTPKTPAEVVAGVHPNGVAASPDGKSLYVTDYDSNTVLQYDIEPTTGVLSPKTPATVRDVPGRCSRRDRSHPRRPERLRHQRLRRHRLAVRHQRDDRAARRRRPPPKSQRALGPYAIAVGPLPIAAADQPHCCPPQIVLFPLPYGVGLFQVRATLTSGGNPLAGKPISLSVGKTALCSATTASNGTASCTLSPKGEIAVLLANDYTATFAGDSNYAGSTASTPAILVGSGKHHCRVSVGVQLLRAHATNRAARARRWSGGKESERRP